MGSERVPTEKQRASTYLEHDKFLKFNSLAEEEGISLSAWIEQGLDRITQEGALVVTLPPDIMEELQKQSDENFRSVEDQARKIIYDWLNHKNVQK